MIDCVYQWCFNISFNNYICFEICYRRWDNLFYIFYTDCSKKKVANFWYRILLFLKGWWKNINIDLSFSRCIDIFLLWWSFVKNLFKEIAENDFFLKQYSISRILEIIKGVQKFLVYFTIIRFLSAINILLL